ncbi:lysophospholipid acyltransferase family protein [Fodinibius halophilus]|uniref:1-acyl-sn-glycerol-3-phosphate acyltransferase n=1 Tax=Fodinibius halophilus TaxID=1736908 RepID=A0A6M1T4B5_9BACT|nr:lysophospholipid acyltransferase family protein [Fodinibius halophilus]NGP88897.1 1-acyl-sn-glycerol-3-phosphate acyltransferase [Fodinibius halophilus]
MRAVFSIIGWIYWAVCIISFFFIVLVLYVLTAPFDRYNRIPNQVLRGLGWLMMKVNPGWSFDIRGADPGKVSEPTIVVANHQSFLDLPLLYLLPWSMKWVAKKDLFKIPILGWIIYMTGQIGINRQSMRSFKKLDKLVEPIQDGIPGMIFPEGTRTEDGDLKPFKNGAFKLAKRYNFNILPIVLTGGYEAMPRGDWTASPTQEFKISVLDPISADKFETETELKEAAYMFIEQELEKLESK